MSETGSSEPMETGYIDASWEPYRLTEVENRLSEEETLETIVKHSMETYALEVDGAEIGNVQVEGTGIRNGEEVLGVIDLNLDCEVAGSISSISRSLPFYVLNESRGEVASSTERDIQQFKGAMNGDLLYPHVILDFKDLPDPVEEPQEYSRKGASY